MKRYSISRVVGTGTRDDPYDLDIRRQFLGLKATNPNQRGNVEVVMPPDPVATPWGLAIVATNDVTPLAGSPGNDMFPDVAGLDIQLSAIGSARWSAFVARARARGIDLSLFSAAGNSASTARDVIHHLGNLLQAGFNEDNFDAAEEIAIAP